jgi:deoxyribodipyrimidine photo-lyase
MKNPAPLIVWFRNDLRLADNPALTHAADSGRPLIALYILDESAGLRPLGAASRWWLDKSLTSLAQDLRDQIGGQLILRRGAALNVLSDLIGETGAIAVYWNRLYDAATIDRDWAVQSALTAGGVECRSFNAGLLNEPWQVITGGGCDFRVFTPYWRAASATAGTARPLRRPATSLWRWHEIHSEALSSWRLHPQRPDWSGGFVDWRPGEAGAQRRLDEFISGAVSGYAAQREVPSIAGTSRLSPHLHFGEVGPRQIYWAVAMGSTTGDGTDVESFQKEIGWREFNHHVLFHHPKIAANNFRTDFDNFAWRDDPPALEAWKRGRTGYPIVDAGMRELWSTGWMHNRVRMIVASFLTKHLLIDWRRGEEWFWDTLVDADLANNVANWQWVAGTGADAAPYFRIFNPVTQGVKYDPRGVYVRRWLPELCGLPDGFVHQPWEAEAATLRTAGLTLGDDYPTPIVDHALARARALNAFRALGASRAPVRSPAA